MFHGDFLAEKLMDWFSSRRAMVALDLIQQHVTKIEDTVVELSRALKLATGDDREAVFQALKRLNQNEEEGDRIRRALIEELAKGELKAKDREDLLHLVRRTDIIADWAKDAGWNLGTLVKYDVKLPAEVWNKLEVIGSELIKEVRALRKSIIALGTDADEALKAELEVEDVEHKIDDEYHATKELLINFVTNLKPPAFMLLRDLLKDLEQVADFSEDAGDVVRSIAIRLKAPHRTR